MPLLEREYVEIFHLVFLQNLARNMAREHFVLKGGSNLRFYFRSIRYSEDIDFDVRTVAKDTLAKNVNKILKSDVLKQALQAKGIEVTHVNEAKRTETTQRWKVNLNADGTERDFPTKIEFSRRHFETEIEFAAVDSEVLRHYQLYPVLLNHYTAEAALLQKLSALSDRKTPQARDVFDINHLFDIGAKWIRTGEITATLVDRAVINAEAIRFEDYLGQVVAFLPTEYQEHYGSEKQWDLILRRVLQTIQEIKI